MIEHEYVIMRKDELYHYGVPGMRRGVRRYTNADGSLNAAGRMRYMVGKYGHNTPVVRTARAAYVASVNAKRKLNNYKIKQRDKRMEKKTGSSEAVRKERSRLIQLERESRIRESKRNASSTAKTLANRTKLGTTEKLARNTETQRYKNIGKAEGKTSGSSSLARSRAANAATVIGKGQQIGDRVKTSKMSWSGKKKEQMKQAKKKARDTAAKKKMERRNKLHTAMRSAEKKAKMTKGVSGGIGNHSINAKKANAYKSLSKRFKKIAK